MSAPDRTVFAVQGSLILAETPGLRSVDYWFHSPFFWRVEQDGATILQSGHDDYIKATGEMTFDVRLVSKPRILGHAIGLHGDERPEPEFHRRTGRSGYRLTLSGDSGTWIIVDSETSFVLQFEGIYQGRKAGGDHSSFTIAEDLAPALFGEKSLDAPGFYHGSLG